ncbi:MAG: hypothetical protein LBG26_02545, partial [Treponema sp.]|nr:hypothetical protein [Treponema sp.]
MYANFKACFYYIFSIIYRKFWGVLHITRVFTVIAPQAHGWGVGRDLGPAAGGPDGGPFHDSRRMVT